MAAVGKLNRAVALAPVARRVGIEPTTEGVKAPCSTAEPPALRRVECILYTFPSQGKQQSVKTEMAKTKLSIRDKIERCQRRAHLDVMLIWIMGALSVPGWIISFHDNTCALLILLPLGLLVLTSVALFCRRIWTLRRLEWESLLALVAFNELIMASRAGQQAL